MKLAVASGTKKGKSYEDEQREKEEKPKGVPGKSAPQATNVKKADSRKSPLDDLAITELGRRNEYERFNFDRDIYT